MTRSLAAGSIDRRISDNLVNTEDNSSSKSWRCGQHPSHVIPETPSSQIPDMIKLAPSVGTHLVWNVKTDDPESSAILMALMGFDEYIISSSLHGSMSHSSSSHRS
ncbi:uncharacterized protein LOC122012110 [Zingiber officinale]|uniref:uncharacterized protein LOC122012110 n=1 Tax=Zingiber officinale TaxID=94328 RepID=UPI001C4BB491|nr:uncharacterized protein LOC122012110 [Zingiber officinale]